MRPSQRFQDTVLMGGWARLSLHLFGKCFVQVVARWWMWMDVVGGHGSGTGPLSEAACGHSKIIINRR